MDFLVAAATAEAEKQESDQAEEQDALLLLEKISKVIQFHPGRLYDTEKDVRLLQKHLSQLNTFSDRSRHMVLGKIFIELALSHSPIDRIPRGCSRTRC